MYSPFAVALTVCLYVAALFGVALWGERSRRVQNALIRSGSVYALSLAVYCTSWTYYGSVGKAATSGVLFLTIYLGPTLGVFFFWILLRRLIRAKNRFRITSIADFIAARYGKSQVLAAVATLIALIGTVPYISLQLKAVVSSFRLITTAGGHELPSWLDTAVGPAAVVLMFAFTVLFGVRHLDPTERHRGMMMALAAECLVKLGAFLACGVFVTFFLFDGFSDIVRQVQALPAGAAYESLNHAPSFVTWSTFMLLAASAFFFLPRQFHVAVIENSDERHIRTAQWVLPTYLLLVNVFVLPIALAGLLLGHPAADADSFVLRLPLEAGQHALSLIIFLGGFSAAMGMVVICAMTMSTMVTNHLLLPVIEQASRLHFLRRHLLRLRWGAVAAFLGISYVFTITVGDSYMLVNMGMLSFAAVLQFAPAVIGGLFWSKANRLGALAGMGSGFVVWSYTLFLPALVKSGWLPETIMTKGPAGLAFLRPENLAGMTGLDPLSHAVFWTLIVNISSYVVVSLLARTGVREDEIRHEFLELLSDTDRTSAGSYGERTIALEPKTRIVGDVLAEYLPAAEASEALARVVVAAGVGGRDRIAIPELAELFKVAENHLAGSVGSAAAYHAMRHAGLFTDEETRQLSASYHDLLAEMKVSPAELRLRVSAYREREETIRLRAGELQSLVESRTEQLRATNDSLMEEIATREKAQEEMERMHKRFVEASHRAGMAEVANNVLHNVGNILNSVQVSSTVLSNKARGLRVAKLSQVAAILGEHEEDLAGFLSSDERGRMIPSYLSRLAEVMTRDRETMLEELVRLGASVHHLTEVVRVQQSNSSFGSVKAEVSLEETVREALRIIIPARESAFDTRLEVEEGLTAVLDKHNLLLILANLLSNAKHSLREQHPQGGGLLTIRGRGVAETAILEVEDDGVGIPPANLDRIFNHGFTTRPRGHGFGLHSSANAATELGGGLTVRSPGPGKGATFTLRIPCSTQAEVQLT